LMQVQKRECAQLNRLPEGNTLAATRSRLKRVHSRSAGDAGIDERTSTEFVCRRVQCTTLKKLANCYWPLRLIRLTNHTDPQIDGGCPLFRMAAQGAVHFVSAARRGSK